MNKEEILREVKETIEFLKDGIKISGFNPGSVTVSYEKLKDIVSLLEEYEKDNKELRIINANISRELLRRDKEYVELLKENSELHDYIERGE